MKISEIAAIIATLPQDAEGAILFDGATHACVDAVWLAQSGDVVFADRSEPVYQDRDRAVGAVTQAENRYITVEEMMGLPPLPDEDLD